MVWNRPAKVREKLMQAVKAAGSQRAFAREHNFSAAYINDVLKNRREISGKLAKALGYTRHVMYWRGIT